MTEAARDGDETRCENCRCAVALPRRDANCIDGTCAVERTRGAVLWLIKNIEQQNWLNVNGPKQSPLFVRRRCGHKITA